MQTETVSYNWAGSICKRLTDSTQITYFTVTS